MLELLRDFTALDAVVPSGVPGVSIDTTTGAAVSSPGNVAVTHADVPAPAGAGGTWTPQQIQSLAQSLYGMTPQAQAFQLKMAQLDAQKQQALLQAELAKQQTSSWSSVWTIGAIAAAGIGGLILWNVLRKKR